MEFSFECRVAKIVIAQVIDSWDVCPFANFDIRIIRIKIQTAMLRHSAPTQQKMVGHWEKQYHESYQSYVDTVLSKHFGKDYLVNYNISESDVLKMKRLVSVFDDNNLLDESFEYNTPPTPNMSCSYSFEYRTPGTEHHLLD